MAKSYKELMDDAFMAYYQRFRELRALSQETAVTMEELFPNGQTVTDRKIMHQMLSMEIVKRVDMNRYWLDEERAADGKGVLKQRIILVVIALILGLGLGILARMGILNF